VPYGYEVLRSKVARGRYHRVALAYEEASFATGARGILGSTFGFYTKRRIV